MVATYDIRSRITTDKDYNCTYKSIDAILPKLIETMFAFDMDFEITAVTDNKDAFILQVYYEYEKRQDICQFFTVFAHNCREHFEIIATGGVL